MYGVILLAGLTIGAIAAPPECKSVGVGKYTGEACNQYYECTKTVWWYNVELKNCPEGQIFDTISKNCSVGSCNTAEITASTDSKKEEITLNTTTTTSTQITTTYSSTATSLTTTVPSSTATTITDIPPNCNAVGEGNYPASDCSQYYQCTKTMWWYNIQLQKCPDGQTFNSSSRNCAVGSCNPTETTVTSTPTPALTTSKPVTPPICKSVGPGNYPADKCQYYYRCTKVMWWYNTKLQKCPDNQIFSLSSKACTAGSCNNSSNSKETTISQATTLTIPTKNVTPSSTSTTTIKVTTTSKSDTPPDCFSVGPGNFPAQNCRQYYQCTKTLWWYNTKLQTCPDGESFDSSSKRCAVGSCN